MGNIIRTTQFMAGLPNPHNLVVLLLSNDTKNVNIVVNTNLRYKYLYKYKQKYVTENCFQDFNICYTRTFFSCRTTKLRFSAYIYFLLNMW